MSFRSPWRLLLALLLLTPLPAAALTLQNVRIEGVQGAQLENVRARLEIARHPRDKALTEASLAFLLRRVPAQVADALEPFGYYDAQAEVDVQRRNGQVEVIVQVSRGSPVRVTESDIQLLGPGAEDPPLARLLGGFSPAKGAVFNHARYEASKADIQRGMLERGYFRSRSDVARVEVERASRSARIALRWNTGPRHVFGETRFEGSHLRPGLLEPLLPYQIGDPYSQASLLQLHRALVELDYFGRIDIQPQLGRGRGERGPRDADPSGAVAGGHAATDDPAQEDDADEVESPAGPPDVPISVSLGPAKRTRYSAGVSFGTDSGASLRLGLDRRWVNERGHKLAAQAEVGQRRSQAGVQYRIPQLEHLPGWWAAALGVREEEIGGGTSQIGTATLSRTARWRGNQLSADLTVQRERFEEVEQLRLVGRNSTLVYPSLRLDRVDADDLLYPSRGYSLSASVRAGSEAIGSDVDFAQLSLASKWIRSQGERMRWIVRGEAATTWVDDFAALPPSLRYFAGGDRSVRGYGYQELSPRDALGEPRGGRHLAVASVELERRIGEQWAVAAFADAGDAFDGGAFKASVGVGMGLRWRSPVGPVRLDIGRGLDEPGRPLRLHIGIGPEL